MSADALLVFNELYYDDFPAGFGNWWSDQLSDAHVAMDIHLYDSFGEASGRSLEEHVAQVRLRLRLGLGLRLRLRPRLRLRLGVR